MFTTREVVMVLSKATMKNVDVEDVTHRMAECQLVLEPFPCGLAQELGMDVASFFFADTGAIRSELKTVTLDPRVPQQRMTVAIGQGVEGTEIENVEVLALTGARQCDEDTGREWIRATFKIRFDLGPKLHREWLVMHFGNALVFSFDREQEDLLSANDFPITKGMQEFSKKHHVTSITITAGDAEPVRLTPDDFENLANATRKGTH